MSSLSPVDDKPSSAELLAATAPAHLETSELLAILDDEYARDILEAAVGEAKAARELAEQLDVSRATVYRRLDRLESAGLVDASTSHDPDGYQRKRFRSTFTSVTVRLTDDAPTATVDATAQTMSSGQSAD